MIRSLLRYLRDYFTLLAMAHSRIDHVRECTREMIRRDGWDVRPLPQYLIGGAGMTAEGWPRFYYTTRYRKWREGWQIMLGDPCEGETWLHYRTRLGDAKVIRWRDGYGVIRGDGSRQGDDLKAFVERNR